MRSKFLRYWTYFRRGHSTYLVFLLSFANFIVIQYRFLIDYIPMLKMIFASLTAFAIVFFVTYLPLATIIGWYDYKRFAVPVDTALIAKANPYSRDMAKALIYLAEGKNEEVIKILRKWTK